MLLLLFCLIVNLSVTFNVLAIVAVLLTFSVSDVISPVIVTSFLKSEVLFT